MDVLVWSNMRREVPGWAEAMTLIRDAGHTVVDPGFGDFDQRHLLAGADALIVGSNPVDAGLLRSAGRARLVAKPGIGVDNIDVAAATELGIGVSNTPGSNSDTVADHALALMLALLRNVVSLDAVTRTGHGWDTWPVIGRELHGAVVAVLGTGNIGAAVVKRLARGFDCTVLANDVAPRPDLERDFGVRYGPLAEILPLADVVTVHVPKLPSSVGLLGEREIACLKSDAIVVNAARDGVVDEDALAAALRDGRIAGAAIDVFTGEPAVDSVFFGLPNTIVTPHIAGYSRASMTRARIMLAEDVVAALDGRPRHLVNPGVLTGSAVRR
ncbi:MAG TPA: NAD(P)-dependent oxidoreductase [Pseudonocardiaceae bacterium]|nr:NAD(P)-dependent oxidoreductase [Pseudonocardiaceae bacterium]